MTKPLLLLPASNLQVPVWSAAIFGVISSLVGYLLKEEALVFLKRDPLQIFAVHTGGGIVGMCLTGLFARYVQPSDTHFVTNYY